MISSMRARSVGEGLVLAPHGGFESRIPAAADDQVVPDNGGRNPHELSDAFPAQPEPVHQHPFPIRSARRNRLSMMDPILPGPPHMRGAGNVGPTTRGSRASVSPPSWQGGAERADAADQFDGGIAKK